MLNLREYPDGENPDNRHGNPYDLVDDTAVPPALRAKAARRAGRRVLQVVLPLSQSFGSVGMLGVAATSTGHTDHGETIDDIEREGWRLDNVGYVFRGTRTTSRDKLLSSGQLE